MPSPTSSGTASDEFGARASRMPRPIAVKASWARNSAVTSTTVEAVASDHETPCSVTARAPNTKPPTWENGRQLVDASRTMRPQMNTQGRRDSRGGTMASQASPSTANSTSCQPTISANSSQPMRRHAGDDADRTRTSRSAWCRATAQPAASAIDSFFTGSDFPAGRRQVGARLYTGFRRTGYMWRTARKDRGVAADGPTLLTGATGFVGSAVARALAARGHRLRLLVAADQRPAQSRGTRCGTGAGRSHRCGVAGACRRRLPLRVPRRGGLPALGARRGGDAARQRRRHAGDDACRRKRRGWSGSCIAVRWPRWG